MSEHWKALLDKAREATKKTNESESTQSLLSLCSPHLSDVHQLIHNHLSALSDLNEREEHENENGNGNDNEDIPRATKILIVDTRRALRFTLCLLSAESSRQDVQNLATSSTHELHKVLSTLIAHRQCDTKCRTMAAQILCNLATSNETTALVILNDIQPSPSESEATKIMLEKMNLVENTRKESKMEVSSSSSSSSSTWSQMIHTSGGSGDRNTLAAIAAALYNSIASIERSDDNNNDTSTSTSSILRLASNLASDTMLICNLMRYILPSKVIQQGCQEVDDKTAEAPDLSDDATEWISRLVEKLCSLGMLSNLYKSLGSHFQSNDGDDKDVEMGITPEQLVLLHCIGSAVEEYARTLNGFGGGDVHPLGGACSCDFELMQSTFHFLAMQYCSFRQKDAKRVNDPERYDGEDDCIDNATILILDILSSSMSVDEVSDTGSRDFAKIRLYVGQTTNILPNALLDLGVLVDRLGIENRGINARELKMTESDQHLVTSIVRLIGNICYRCRENQDLVRKTKVPIPHASSANVEEYTQFPKEADASADGARRNGLHVLLSCTSFAYGCFTLREWAIVAIRNVLQDNKENQKHVEELEAQQAIDTPELRKLGVKVKLDKRGQVTVSKSEPNDE